MEETQTNDESIMNSKQPTITGQVDAGVKRARHNPAFMGAMLAYSLLGDLHTPIIDFNDNSPNIKTYGSKATKSLTPEEWKNKKREQGRNELCDCGSGKKYKKCCALSV